jgi:hypothetical protein
MGAVKNKWVRSKEKGKRIDKKGKRRRGEEEGENREKRWYGITRIRQYTEEIKAILKKGV